MFFILFGTALIVASLASTMVFTPVVGLPLSLGLATSGLFAGAVLIGFGKVIDLLADISKLLTDISQEQRTEAERETKPDPSRSPTMPTAYRAGSGKPADRTG